MARRQYFTVDEALSQLLAEEDDFLFGNGDSDSSGEDCEEDFRQAQSLVTPHSADRQAALEAFYTDFSYFRFTERSYPKKQQPERWMGMLCLEIHASIPTYVFSEIFLKNSRYENSYNITITAEFFKWSSLKCFRLSWL